VLRRSIFEEFAPDGSPSGGSRWRRRVRGRGHHASPEVEPGAEVALLAEVETEGGKVAVVARWHGISESLLYNWRSA
jgi:hypothetical protein